MPAPSLSPVHPVAPAPAWPAPLPAPLTATIRCVCVSCQTVMETDSRFAGTRAACPTCQMPIDIPSPMPAPLPITPVAPQVVFNVVNTAHASAAVPLPPEPPAAPPPRRVSYPVPPKKDETSSNLGCFLLFALVVLTVGGLGIYGSGAWKKMAWFKPKPQEQILGTWKGYDVIRKQNVHLVFYGDGKYDIVLDDSPPASLRYRFVDDRHIEVSLPGTDESERCEVSFPTKDEMIISSPGQAPGKFKRVN